MFQNGQTHFKNLQQMLQDFKSVSDHFVTLRIKRLRQYSPLLYFPRELRNTDKKWNTAFKYMKSGWFNKIKLY